MLTDSLINKVVKYSELLHEHDYCNFKNDMNYFVYSKDPYMNILITNELIQRMSEKSHYKTQNKTIDNISFRSVDNIVDIDFDCIQRKNRGEVYNFIMKIVKRSPMLFDKHIIVLRNFDKVMLRFQEPYKSLLERGVHNSCFIMSATNHMSVNDTLTGFFHFLRVPLINSVNMKKLLEKICVENEIDGINIDSVINSCDNDLFTCLCEIEKLDKTSETHSTFENLFEKEIEKLFDFMKKSKSLERVIESIRISINKLLYYSLPDEWVCNTILKKCVKITKLKKNIHKIVDLIATGQYDMLKCSKKIFVYEYMFLEMYDMMHN